MTAKSKTEIKDQLVDIEVAAAAKQKGFDQEVKRYFSKVGASIFESVPLSESQNVNIDNFDLSQPTQSQLSRWLRERFDIDIQPITHYDHETKVKSYRLGIVYVKDNSVETLFLRPEEVSLKFIQFETFELAMEAGLLQALKLI